MGVIIDTPPAGRRGSMAVVDLDDVFDDVFPVPVALAVVSAALSPVVAAAVPPDVAAAESSDVADVAFSVEASDVAAAADKVADGFGVAASALPNVCTCLLCGIKSAPMSNGPPCFSKSCPGHAAASDVHKDRVERICAGLMVVVSVLC